MRSARLLATVAALTLAGVGAAGCGQTVSGHGTLAAGVATAAPTTSAPARTTIPAPSPQPRPTVDPTRSREQVTCLLVEATIRNTNDRFNKAASRSDQVSILQRGAATLGTQLHSSRLPGSDRVVAAGAAVVAELNKLVNSAKAGRSPSTTPYNNAASRVTATCGSL